MDGGGSGVKRVPSYVAPDLATDIRRHIAACIRQRKGSFSCHYVTEQVIFSLPAGKIVFCKAFYIFIYIDVLIA